MTSLTPAVVAGAERNGLGVGRSLAAGGMPLVAVESSAADPGLTLQVSCAHRLPHAQVPQNTCVHDGDRRVSAPLPGWSWHVPGAAQRRQYRRWSNRDVAGRRLARQ